VPRRATQAMRAFWDDAATRNAMFYVDTSLDYDAPDPEAFLAGGRRIAEIALDESKASLAGHGLAVEIGCGLGRVCAALAERFDRVVGVDISTEMVRQARERVTDPRVDFRHSDGLSLPGVDDASADLVVSFTVFQHAPSRSVIQANLHEAARVLREGGVLAVQWNATPGAVRWRLHRLWMAAVRRLGRADPHGRDVPQFLGSRVPLPAMDRMLAAAGLQRVAMAEPDSLFTWAWAVRRAGAT
jgi:SAM-dependent methyltransferase